MRRGASLMLFGHCQVQSQKPDPLLQKVYQSVALGGPLQAQFTWLLHFSP